MLDLVLFDEFGEGGLKPGEHRRGGGAGIAFGLFGQGGLDIVDGYPSAFGGDPFDLPVEVLADRIGDLVEILIGGVGGVGGKSAHRLADFAAHGFGDEARQVRAQLGHAGTDRRHRADRGLQFSTQVIQALAG